MRRPRVLVCLSRLRPQMGGGSIAMLRLADALAERGCEVQVASTTRPAEGIGRPAAQLSAEAVAGADLILAGAGAATGAVCRIAKRTRSRARIASFVHSVVRPVPPPHERTDLVVWASAAMQEYARSQGFRTRAAEAVLWPLIYPDLVRTEPGDAVTLVNPMPEKGGVLFWEIARRLPDVEFMVVRGGWRREQAVIPRQVPDNVTILAHRSDPREVFRRTRVLLYPKGASCGPGWLRGVGMTALEAACSGIPTIAYPGAGLVEALGDAAVWVPTLSARAWAEAVESLQDPGVWAERSTAARARAEAVLDPEGIVSRAMEFATANAKAA